MTRNVTDLSALVALLATTTAVVAVASLGAFAGKVTGLSATVASLFLGGLLAFTALYKMSVQVCVYAISNSNLLK